MEVWKNKRLGKNGHLILAARVFLVVILAIILAAAGSCLRSAHGATDDEWDAKVYSVEEIKLLAAAMELENGCNSDLCVLLTGTVILNRVAHPRYPNTIKGVLFQAGQYASHTVKNLYKVKVSDRVLSLALRLVTHRSMDKELIFQSQYKHLGHIKYIIDGEYFATE